MTDQMKPTPYLDWLMTSSHEGVMLAIAEDPSVIDCLRREIAVLLPAPVIDPPNQKD